MSEFDIAPKHIQDDMGALEKWLADRLGKFTGSNAWKCTKRLKGGGRSQEWTNYKIELIGERLTGMRQDVFLNAAMLHGVETQSDAERAYENHTDTRTQEVWFVHHKSILMSGASPDRLVGSDGVLEIKCPLSKTHLETLLSKEIPEKHIPQLMWELACTGRQWVDFVSFDPRLPKELRLFVKRFYRDDEKISEMENTVREFLEELDGDMRALGAFTPVAPKQGDGRKEITGAGWSDNVPPEEFSSVESLIAKGLIKRGL